MALYWIGYDLDKPGQDYTDLISRLKQLGAVRVLKSDWLLGHDETNPKQIRDDLIRFLDDNDRILVTELKNNAAWHDLLANGDDVAGIFTSNAT
jgi:hypothetical protein